MNAKQLIQKTIALFSLFFISLTWVYSNSNFPNASLITPALSNIKVGEPFDFPIKLIGLTKNDSVIAYQFELVYDTNLLDYVSAKTDNSLSIEGEIAVNNQTNGILLVSYMSSKAIEKDGILLNIAFKAKSKGTFVPKFGKFLLNSKLFTNLVLNSVTISDYEISGKVYSDASKPITSGYALLLRKKILLFEKVDSVSIIDGIYKFNQISQGEYTVFVVPSKEIYPLSLPTYLGNKAFWSLATLIKIEAGYEDKGFDVIIPFMPELKGLATIRGVVEWGNLDLPVLKSSKGITGKPVKKLSVVLRSANKSTGSIIAQTETDEFGNFEFTNVPDGMFIVEVDMPGYPMIQIPQIVVDKGVAMAADGKTSFNKIEMIVDKSGVKMLSDIFNPVSVVNNIANTFNLYPNPASSQLFIKSESVIKYVEIYNSLGVKLNVCYTQVLDVNNLPVGSYYLRIITNKGVSTQVPFVISR